MGGVPSGGGYSGPQAIPTVAKPKPKPEPIVDPKTRTRYAGSKKELSDAANVVKKTLLGQ